MKSKSPWTACAKRQAVRSGYLGDHQNQQILQDFGRYMNAFSKFEYVELGVVPMGETFAHCK